MGSGVSKSRSSFSKRISGVSDAGSEPDFFIEVTNAANEEPRVARASIGQPHAGAPQNVPIASSPPEMKASSARAAMEAAPAPGQRLQPSRPRPAALDVGGDLSGGSPIRAPAASVSAKSPIGARSPSSAGPRRRRSSLGSFKSFLESRSASPPPQVYLCAALARLHLG